MEFSEEKFKQLSHGEMLNMKVTPYKRPRKESCKDQSKKLVLSLMNMQYI